MRTETLDALPEPDRGYCLTVMSSDPHELVCKGCGERRVIFQAHYFGFHGDQVRARCKSCHETAAKERGGNIFVKSVSGNLPGVWKKDRRKEEHPAVKKARQQRAALSEIGEP